ncbi:ribosome biosynthesis protein rrb1 [Gonapodya sp. JEL0774]|nr:ribosome biosynthesis protein rrb1 [Gonapodya sp. JEL0774]
MSNKRSAESANSTGDASSGLPSSQKRPHLQSKSATNPATTPENGDDLEFEDPWEDEVESDGELGEVVVAEDSSDEDDDGDGGGEDVDEVAEGDAMAVDGDVDSKDTKGKSKKQSKKSTKNGVTVLDNDDEDDGLEERVYLPGQALEPDEVLVVDNSAYEMLHSMGVEWPCLSFDVLKDGLGQDRRKFPMTAFLAAGSQADIAAANRLYILKLSHLQRTKHDDPIDDSASDASDDSALDEDPVLEHRAIPHPAGGVNRVRIAPDEHVIATWADSGVVCVWDVADQVTVLERPGVLVGGIEARAARDVKPVYSVKQHKGVEGFAMDWSRVAKGKLLTGDTASHIYLTSRTPTSYATSATPFAGHTSSVEDLQWSPTEATVFASCSADKTIRVWDTRATKKPQVTVKDAHTQDVNVISWSKTVDYLLASGGDEGGIAVWDLRAVAASASSSPPKRPDPAALFTWHRGPITSIEWHPTESSVLVASGADDQCTVWDLSVERDPEEEREVMGRTGKEALGGVEVPPQLMFVHQGQSNVKEIHWHPQLPGVLVSTAFDGFNIFKTINT